mgnify:CR=1 FL=1|tara:strand:- start:128 stop:322 length:195 start_codon:yes stop_codon:yes gene_type:complete
MPTICPHCGAKKLEKLLWVPQADKIFITLIFIVLAVFQISPAKEIGIVESAMQLSLKTIYALIE